LSNRRLGREGHARRALAPYACDPEQSRGRRYPEPEEIVAALSAMRGG